MTFTQTGSNRAQHGQDPVGEPESSNIHEMLRQIRNEITSGAPPRGETQAAPPKRDYEFSFDLLTRTADVIDLLQDRCRTLEAEKDGMVDSRAELGSAQASLRQWQEMSTSLKGKLDECARQLAETRTRAEAAEKRADGLAGRLESSEQRAAMAEELARGFHDRIVTSFGNAARLQEVLMEITAREAAAAKAG